MSIRHTIFIKERDTEKTVYRREIFGNNIFADDIFYKNLGIVLVDDTWSDYIELDLNQFYTEWYSYTRRKFDKKALSDVLGDLDESVKEDCFCSMLVMNLNNVYLQLFTTYRDLLPYMEDYKVDKLDKKYELGIEIG